jgi:hypothetical protein
MLKTITVIACAAIVAAFVSVMPGFSPQVEAASDATVLAKGDRLDMRPLGTACSQRNWPYFEATCVRDRAQPAGQPSTIRVITTDRRG